jgi:hypothetical protein
VIGFDFPWWFGPLIYALIYGPIAASLVGILLSCEGAFFGYGLPKWRHYTVSMALLFLSGLSFLIQLYALKDESPGLARWQPLILVGLLPVLLGNMANARWVRDHAPPTSTTSEDVAERLTRRLWHPLFASFFVLAALEGYALFSI